MSNPEATEAAPAPRFVIPGPGAYDMPAALYHTGPTPTESLSSSGAKILAAKDGCPALFRHKMDHKEHKRVFDIGTAEHLLTLEPHLFDEAIAIVRGKTAKGAPSPGYASDDAKAQREAAYDAGKTPLLPEELQLVQDMRAALAADPIAAEAFKGGMIEKSLFWQDVATGIWCRSRPDFIADGLGYTINLKTAARADPESVHKAINNLAYFQSQAWELDAVEAVFGTRPGRSALVVVSSTYPITVITAWIDPLALAKGRDLNHFARGVFAWCLATGEWPSFRPVLHEPPRAYTFGLLPWKDIEINRRWEDGELTPPPMPGTVKESE